MPKSQDKNRPPKGTKKPKKALDTSKAPRVNSATDHVVKWIEHYVTSNNLQIGAQLPSEDQIVEQTGKSRTSVREAVTRLRSVGVVDSRRKRGMVLVRSVSVVELLDVLVDDEPDWETIGHIGGFRSAIEIGLVPCIFKRSSPKLIRELNALYTRMEEAVDDPATYIESDRMFHSALIHASGNKLAGWLWDLLRPFFMRMLGEREGREVSLKRHKDIISALEMKDPFAFERAMSDHHLRKLDHEGEFYRGQMAYHSSDKRL